MKHIQIIDKASITGKKRKIICINSYERKIAHKYAESKGLTHRSIIDYTQMRMYCSINRVFDGGCCEDCDSKVVTIYGKPYSFVEINNGSQKKYIGNETMIPSPVIFTFFSGKSQITENKIAFKKIHMNNIINYHTF